MKLYCNTIELKVPVVVVEACKRSFEAMEYIEKVKKVLYVALTSKPNLK